MDPIRATRQDKQTMQDNGKLAFSLKLIDASFESGQSPFQLVTGPKSRQKFLGAVNKIFQKVVLDGRLLSYQLGCSSSFGGFFLSPVIRF